MPRRLLSMYQLALSATSLKNATTPTRSLPRARSKPSPCSSKIPRHPDRICVAVAKFNFGRGAVRIILSYVLCDLQSR